MVGPATELAGLGGNRNAGPFAQHALRVPKWWQQSPELSWALPLGGSEALAFTASRFMAYNKLLKNSQDFTEALRATRALAANITADLRKVPGTDPDFEVFPYS